MSEGRRRVQNMANITIEPASAERFADVQHAITGGGDGPSCQCQWWTMPNAEFRSLTRADKEVRFEEELGAPVSPGLIAYVDNVPAGWVRVGPRTLQARIARTRLVTSGSPEPLDDPTVWAVTCFVIRRDHRGIGLAHLLLDAAIEYAQDHGARVIEGYPVDTTEVKRSASELFHGTLAMFEESGFSVASRPSNGRAVMTLSLPVAAT